MKLFFYISLFVTLTLFSLSPALSHEHHPPHHGTLVVLGEEFAHVELLLDSSTGLLTAYLLDGEAENPVETSQTSLPFKLKANGKTFLIKLKPVANPLTGEVVGHTSQYQATSLKLKGLDKFEGTILHINAKGGDFKNVWFVYPEGNEGVTKPKDL